MAAEPRIQQFNLSASHYTPSPGLFFRHLSQNWAIPKLRICPKLRQNWLKLSLFFPKLRFSEIFCNSIFTSENCIFWFSSIFIVLNTSILCDIKVLLDYSAGYSEFASDSTKTWFSTKTSIALDKNFDQNSTQFWPKLRKFCQNSENFDQNSENFGQNSGFRKFNLVMLPEKRRKNKPDIGTLD